MTTNQNLILSSPLEQFEVSNLVGLNAPIIGLNFSLTNLGFYVVLVLIVFIGVQVLSLNSSAPQGALVVPSR
jgi:F-type H+-transporting ATPase subunit a